MSNKRGIRRSASCSAVQRSANETVPRRRLPPGFPAGVRRVVEVPIDDAQPFFFSQVVVVDDPAAGESILMVAVGYEITDRTMTWYLGDPVIDWADARSAHLRELHARSQAIDPSALGAVVRTITVPIVSLVDHPALFGGATVQAE